MKKVSVIVPVYNAQPWLKFCLDSLVSQTYKDLEIVLVDDGSTDHSGSICDEYGKAFEFIKVIHKENGGVSDARNVGLESISGNYVSFVDSDDAVSPFFVEKMVTVMELDKSVDVVSCDYFYDKNIEQLYHNSQFEPSDTKYEIREDNIFQLPFERSFNGFSCNKLLKKELIVGKFDLNICMFEDLLFNIEYLRLIRCAALINEKLYFYRCTHNLFDVIKNPQRISVIDAYSKIMPIYKECAPQFVHFLEYSCLKTCVLMRAFALRYRNSPLENIDVRHQLESYIKRVLPSMLKSHKVSFSKKLYLWRMYHFPLFIWRIKKFIGL